MSRGGGAFSTPRSFLSCVVAKKICTSLRDTSVAASWPKLGLAFQTLRHSMPEPMFDGVRGGEGAG
jgi:hypothetical protein